MPRAGRLGLVFPERAFGPFRLGRAAALVALVDRHGSIALARAVAGGEVGSVAGGGRIEDAAKGLAERRVRERTALCRTVAT